MNTRDEIERDNKEHPEKAIEQMGYSGFDSVSV